MNGKFNRWQQWVVAIVVGAGVAGAAGVDVGARGRALQGVQTADTEKLVQRQLERLPYLGVFDYVVFRVNAGRVYLSGYSFDGRLKTDAELAVRRVSGVTEVSNAIEVLPVSKNDDRIRWATYYRIYTDDFLSRYVPGGASQVWREVQYERLFPGMQPVGIYPIHIVVKHGRIMLLGVVDSQADRHVAEVRAREVSGVFNVQNDLVLAERRSGR